MFVLLSLPITLTSVILYLFLSILGNGYWVWLVGMILSLSTVLIVCKKNFKEALALKRFLSVKNVSLLFLILLFVFCKAFVISPFVVTKKTDAFEHIQVTDVGDYYKHTFVVNSLRLDGLPPGHPYFPPAKLSYYFGYYLIPASISRLFSILPHYAFYVFTIITDFLGLLIVLRVFNQHLKTYWAKLLSLMLLISGVGVSILPEVLNKFPLFGFTLNPEAFATETGFQLINNYKALLFVPQHFFAACLAVGLINYLIWEKPKVLLTGIVASFIFLSSIFVSWTMALWFALIFYFYPQKRPLLIKVALFSAVLLLPYVFQLSERENIFRLNKFQPHQFLDGTNFIFNLFNMVLTAIFQYGLILVSLPILVYLKGQSYIKNNKAFILGLGLPFVITWFIRSPYYNDFSLRGLMPLQLILPLVFIKMLEQLKQGLLKITLMGLAMLIIGLGFLGLYLEYSKHWKSRLILHPEVSEFILEVRKLPDSTKLAAIDLDRWVEFIPSLGFKKVLSPYLFDSYVYFVGSLTAEHGTYERLARELFLETDKSSDLKTLVSEKNTQLNKLNGFFNRYKADQLILNNQLWVKKDINPWLAIFETMDVKRKPLTGSYTLLDYPSLLDKTSFHQVSIKEEGLVLPVKDEQITLSKGLWYLAGCDFEKRRNLHLELEDYYLIFNQEVDGSSISCAGKIFYLQADEDVRLTTNSNIDTVYAFPVDIKLVR